MATVRASLSLNSADVLTSPLTLSVVANLTCDSGSLIRAKVKGTAADTNDMIVYLANDKNDRAYLYIKNLESLAPDKTYAVHATKVDSLIEYGVFGNDNSAVIFAGSGA